MFCNHANQRTYYHPATHGLTREMCAECADRANRLGMDWCAVERRDIQTRPFVPRWLQWTREHNNHKDLTGEVA
jgi:hypothetical protein